VEGEALEVGRRTEVGALKVLERKSGKRGGLFSGNEGQRNHVVVLLVDKEQCSGRDWEMCA
jgi:hypothetical protein